MDGDGTIDWTSKRAHVRITWKFIIRFRKRSEQQPRLPNWEISNIQDISKGGCYFLSSSLYATGDILDLEIQFPFLGKPMHFTGEVRRCEIKDTKDVAKYGVGVQFMEMDEAKKNYFIEALDKFLKEHPTK